MSRIVVVGAGVGGLAAAARLAATGHEVTVYERSDRVGGKLGRHRRDTPAGVFHFDTGPGLLTLPQVFAELFAATRVPRRATGHAAGQSGPGHAGAAERASRSGAGAGSGPRRPTADPWAELADHLDPVPLDPIVRHVFPDGSVLDSCAEPAAFAARIGATLGPDAAADWRRLWRRARRVWDASWRDVLRRDIDSPLALLRLAWRAGDLAAIRPGQTLRGLGRAHLRDPRLRMLLDRYATYTGADPRRAPAALAAIPYAELAFGGWYLRGGLATLADALLDRCLDLGVVVRTGTAVTGIDAAGGRVHAVRLAGGGRAPADVVVANVDALTVYRDLLPTPGRLGRLADRSLAGFVLLLGVRTAPGPAGQAGASEPAGQAGVSGPAGQARASDDRRAPRPAHHTVYFPPDYDAEFDAVFGDPGRGVPARPAPDPAVFVTVADDPLVRPDGHEAWFVLVNAARQGRSATGVDWRRPGLAEAYADRILDVLAARGADVRDRLVFREIRTPADLAASTGAPGGAIYGTTGGLLRPTNRGPVRGLFLVGGSTHPGGGLPMVTLSAGIVAERIGPA